MMPSHQLKLLHHVLTFICTLAAIHIGLLAVGYNILAIGFLASFAKPIEYIIGLAGLGNLLLCIMHASFCHCSMPGSMR